MHTRAARLRASRDVRLPRFARRALVVLAVLVALLAGFAVFGYATAPSVAGAPQLVRSRLRADGGRPIGLPLPARVSEATVAVEDRRFYQHGAVDLRSVGRVIWWTVTGRDQDPGGATLTIQLAKLLYGAGGGPVALAHELAAAFKLQHAYSREQILRMYLNSVYYGHQAYGVTAASRTYFGRSPDRLTWAQATLLAGLPQAPTAYDPLRHLARARARQRQVLDAMVSAHELTAQQAARVYAEPLGLR